MPNSCDDGFADKGVPTRTYVGVPGQAIDTEEVERDEATAGHGGAQKHKLTHCMQSKQATPRYCRYCLRAQNGQQRATKAGCCVNIKKQATRYYIHSVASCALGCVAARNVLCLFFVSATIIPYMRRRGRAKKHLRRLSPYCTTSRTPKTNTRTKRTHNQPATSTT